MARVIGRLGRASLSCTDIILVNFFLVPLKRQPRKDEDDDSNDVLLYSVGDFYDDRCKDKSNDDE